MLIKPGVDIERLYPEIRGTLSKIEKLYPDFVITSTYEGNHVPSSKHYCNDAIDIRCYCLFVNRNVIPVKATVLWLDEDVLAKALGPKYLVIGEKDHIHIQYNGE